MDSHRKATYYQVKSLPPDWGAQHATVETAGDICLAEEMLHMDRFASLVMWMKPV